MLSLRRNDPLLLSHRIVPTIEAKNESTSCSSTTGIDELSPRSFSSNAGPKRILPATP
jgi:hypothetical protein